MPPLTDHAKANGNQEMKLKFWGTRGSIASPGKDTLLYGGNTCCLELTLESDRKIVIDAGTGIRLLGERYTEKGEAADILLLITHIHWDHVQGFAFFEPIYNSCSRIAVDGFPNAMKGLRAMFDNRMGDGFFPIRFEELKARIHYVGELSRHPIQIDGTKIEAIPLYHPQGALGYAFREGSKKLVFITDNELVMDGPRGKTSADYIAFCQEADILIHDAQFKSDEIEQHRGWGHSDCASAVELAVQAHAKRLILFHHAPSRSDEEVKAIVEGCRRACAEMGHNLLVDAAMEGGELML